MKIQGSKEISKKIQKQIGNYSFEVGVLQDEVKKIRKKGGTKNFAGLTISATGPQAKNRKGEKISLVQVASILDKHHFKWLRSPFKKQGLNQDVIKVVNELAAQLFGKKSLDNKRLENAVQAVIRNPILRGDYGNNARSTIRAKGFDKLGIDTAQFFKSIKAKRI